MVEVLRKGKTDADKSVTFKCGQCSARLRYKKSEGRFVGDDRDGAAYVFRCPDCKNDNWIAASVVDRNR